MPSTQSLGLAALAILSQTLASPLASGHHAARVSLATPTYTYPNGSSGYTSTQPHATAVTVGTQQTITAISSPTTNLFAPRVHSAAPLPISSFISGPVLAPAISLNHPVDDITQLKPTKGDTLYYADTPPNPSIEHTFALLNTTSRYKSVVLGHSSHVQSVSCADDGILVTFANATGFQYAAGTWPDAGEDFVLVTATDGCGSSTDQRTCWLIDSLSYSNGSNAIDTKVAKEMAYEDAFDEVHIVWGKYKPVSNATTAKRGFFDDLGHAGQGVFSAIESKASGVASVFESKASEAVDAWHGFEDALTSPTMTGQFDVPLAAKTGDPSPWGGAKLMFEDTSKISSIGNNKSLSAPIETDFKLFCVDCSLDSYFTLLGQAAVSFNDADPQVTKLTAEIDGNIIANLNLGLVATAEFQDTRSVNLWTYPVPDMGITVKDIITAGLTVSMDASATLDIVAEGDLLAGVTMTIPDFKATVDFINADGSGNSMSGNPVWEKHFNVSGALGATVTLGLPISLNLGVQIPKINFNKSIDAHNDVSLNVLDLKTFNLDHRDWPLDSACQPLELPGSEEASTIIAADTASTLTSIASTLTPTATTIVDPAALVSSVAGGTEQAGGTGSLVFLPTVGTGVPVAPTVAQATGIVGHAKRYA